MGLCVFPYPNDAEPLKVGGGHGRYSTVMARPRGFSLGRTLSCCPAVCSEVMARGLESGRAVSRPPSNGRLQGLRDVRTLSALTGLGVVVSQHESQTDLGVAGQRRWSTARIVLVVLAVFVALSVIASVALLTFFYV